MRRSFLIASLSSVGLVVGCSSDPTTSGVAIDAPAAGDGAAVDAPPDAIACGVRSGMRGKTKRTVMVDGTPRTFIAYIPEGPPQEAMPFLFVMHGYTMSGQAMYDVTELADLADREHVAVVFPDGQGGPDSALAPWNVTSDGSPVCTATGGIAPPNAPGDDFAFLDAMVADVSQDQCLDRDHTYMTGFSMGGYFTHHAGCLRDDIRAIAPASGGTHDLASCTTGHKPVIIFHGKADEVIPAGCDDPDSFRVPDVTPSATAWAIHNGCNSTETTTTSVTGGRCKSFTGCPADGQVTICTFDLMPHCWAGGPPSLYGCPTYASATDLAWQFFKDHAW